MNNFFTNLKTKLTPVGKKLKSVKWKNYINYIGVALFTLIFMIVSLSGGLKQSTANLLEQIAISIVLAVSLSLVVGFLGELSLGHAGFMCVGAYLGGLVANLISDKIGNNLFAFIIAMIVGAVCAGLCGFVIGLPALRLKGDYLAITTLAFGEIIRVLFSQSKLFGATLGLDTVSRSKKGGGLLSTTTFFILAFLIVLLTIAIVQNLMKSKHGRAITSIRDNEIASKATGINVTRYKLMAFIISACLAGVAGVLYSYTQSGVTAPKFDYNYSIEIRVIVVIGGMGSISGSIIAATLITILNYKLQVALSGNMSVLKNIIYAVILILIVIYNNAPALKGFREKYNFKNLIAKIKKGKKDPSADADDTARWDVVPTKIPMDEVLSTDMTPQSEYTPDKPSKEGK